MSCRVLALSAFLLAGTPLPTLAQNWLRSESDEARDHRILTRADGSLVDLTSEDFDRIARLRTLNHEGDTLVAYRLETVLGGVAEAGDMGLFPDGTVAVAGTHTTSPTGSDPWIGRFDPWSGAYAWLVRIPWSDATFERVLVTQDALYGVGYIFGETSLIVTKMDHDGNVEWHRRVGLAGQDDKLNDLCALPGGGLVLLLEDTNEHTHVFAIGANGALSWHNFYDTFTAEAVCATELDEIWVTGVVASEDIVVLALTPGGQTLWSKGYVGYPSTVKTLRPKSGGGAILTATREVNGDYRPSLMALDPTGNTEWLRMYDIGGGYRYQGAKDVLDVGERGWVFWAQENAYKRLLAVQPDGTANLPCVVETNLFTLVEPITIRPDEPPTTEFFVYTQDAEPWLLQPIAETNPIDLECGDPCKAIMLSVGPGLAGSGLITPELTGRAGACAGTPHPRLVLEKGLGGTFGVFGHSFTPNAIPIFGGTLYLDPQNFDLELIQLDGPNGLAGTGSWSLDVTTNLISHMGGSIYVQVILRDLGAPQGWSFSNGLEVQID